MIPLYRLLSLTGTIITLIVAIIFIKKKNPVWKKWLSCSILFFVSIILVSTSIPATSTLTPQKRTQAVAESPKQPVTQAAYTLGSDMDAFKNQYPETHLPAGQITKNIYNNRFLMSVEANSEKPEKVENISISLQKRKSDWQTASPEQLPVKTIEEANIMVDNLIPPDSKLKREKTFRDSSLTPPAVHYKTYRQYESNWLAENFPADPHVEVRDKKTFVVIIGKVAEGYLEITISIDPEEWEEIDGGYLESSGWQEVKQ